MRELRAARGGLHCIALLARRMCARGMNAARAGSQWFIKPVKESPASMLNDLLNQSFEAAALIFEALGVLAIMLGTAFALLEAARNAMQRCTGQEIFELFRTRLAKSILIGVEFLIAADIVGTVIIEPTAERLGTLALIVLIRTFMSFALEVEIEGRWPWQRGHSRHEDK